MTIIRLAPLQLKLPLHVKLPSSAREFARVVASCFMVLQLSFAPLLSAAPPEKSASTKTAPAKPADPILKVMQSELSRASSSLSKSDPAPYFMSYTVNDQDIVVLVGAYG